ERVRFLSVSAYRTPSNPKTRHLPMLERVAIKTPCKASWDDMVGDDIVRFCCTCSKSVYDLSAMDAIDAEAFLERHLPSSRSLSSPLEEEDERACVRIFRRPDGRILTGSECDPALRKRHARRALKLVGTSLAMAAATLAVLEPITRPTLHEDPEETWAV